MSRFVLDGSVTMGWCFESEADRSTATVLDALPVFLGLGREHGLSSYDASYLHLAMRERLPLATRDAALRAAARAVGVGWFVPNGSARHRREDDDE